MAPPITCTRLVRLPAALAVAKTVEILKANSSRWIHPYRVLHRSFSWPSGYAAFSVSESNAAELSRYISYPVEHHRNRTFQEELIACEEVRNGVRRKLSLGVTLSSMSGLSRTQRHDPRPAGVATILRRCATGLDASSMLRPHPATKRCWTTF